MGSIRVSKDIHSSLKNLLNINKILSFYNELNIFFRQNGGTLQTFLYFCALELVPLLAFGGIWLMTIDLLKINF